MRSSRVLLYIHTYTLYLQKTYKNYDLDQWLAVTMATTMASSSEETINITTGQDIANLISKCSKCTSITNGGNYITSFTHLKELIIPEWSKVAIVVNTEEDFSLNVGHWIVLTVFLGEVSGRHLILCDGLNETETKAPKVMQAIKHFCQLNRLTYTNLNLRCQLQTSQTCGFISLFFLAKASMMSLDSFILLRNTMKRNSVHTNEEVAINFVKLHYSKNREYL